MLGWDPYLPAYLFSYFYAPELLCDITDICREQLSFSFILSVPSQKIVRLVIVVFTQLMSENEACILPWYLIHKYKEVETREKKLSLKICLLTLHKKLGIDCEIKEQSHATPCQISTELWDFKQMNVKITTLSTYKLPDIINIICDLKLLK